MPVSVDCECGFSFQAADKFAGKLVRCPECSGTVKVASSTVSRSAALRAQRREKSAEPTKAAEAKPKSRPSRPQRPAGYRKKTAGNSTNTIMIAGGVTIVALLGIIGFMAMSRGEEAISNNPDRIIVGTPEKPGGSVDLLAKALEEDRAQREQEARLAKAKEKSEAKVKASAPSASGAGKSGLSKYTAIEGPDRSGSGTKQAKSVDLTAQVGDRISWLFDNGRGFARKEDMWVYSGDPRAIGIKSRSSVVGLVFHETLRTDSFVELFNAEKMLRVRLKQSEFIAFDLRNKTETPMDGGRFSNSTADASSWLTDFSVPTSHEPETAIEAGDLPSLIAAVEKQVARIDVITEQGKVAGSGFLSDASGRIVTNYHVVEGATNVRAVFKDAGADGKEVVVPVVGFLHVDRKRDIAVLQGEFPAGFQFRGLPLSTETRKGETVVAFGSPLGLLDSTASNGIISGYREAAFFNKEMGTDAYAGDWLQTTTPISSGNSGGPLVNEIGEVVAINTMTLRIGQQLNFAISAGDIKQALELSQPTPQEITPKNLPVVAHRAARSGGVGRDGRPRRSGKRIPVRVGRGVYVNLWPIEGTLEATQLLGELQEVRLDVVSRNKTVKTSVTNSARKAVKSSGVRVVIDEGPILLIVPNLTEISDRVNELELFAHLYVVKDGEMLRLWRGSTDLGRISNSLLKQGSLGRKMGAAVEVFFGDLVKKIKNAKENPADRGAETDPFK